MTPSRLFLTALTSGASAGGAHAAEKAATSPGGWTDIIISDESGQANFALKFKGPILDQGGGLSRGPTIVGSRTRAVGQTWALTGKRLVAANAAPRDQPSIPLETRSPARRASRDDTAVAYQHGWPARPS